MNTTDSRAVQLFAELVEDYAERLDALDQRVGDGDFGGNLRGGLQRASAATAESDFAELAEVFLNDVGGTSGPLLGLLFAHIADAEGEDWARRIARGSAAGLAAIQEIGGARPGDRTLVDALAAAVAQLERGASLGDAATAAVTAALGTAKLRPRAGRSSYLADRAIGVPDPGAIGVALLFAALARASGVEVSLPELSPAPEPGVPLPTTDTDVEEILQHAAEATEAMRHASAETIAGWLEAVAARLESARNELCATAARETHLSPARLAGELTRTVFQARLFAERLRQGRLGDVRIDPRDSEWPPAARPELRRTVLPIGTVLVFAASNFPFAFSVFGGDTVSALAAGCPVIVKAHPGHLELSRRTSDIVSTVLAEVGAPRGAFALIEGDDAGTLALRDRRVRAGAFTGSTAVGRILFDIASGRPDPIPFYGELGSTNPVVITPSGWRERADEIAAGFSESFSLGVGQFCTKPGVVFAPDAHALAARVSPAPSGPMLTDKIRSGFDSSRKALAAREGITELVVSRATAAGPQISLLLTDARTVAQDPAVMEQEMFGPAALLVEYSQLDEVYALLDAFPGALTATVQGADGDPDGAEAVDRLAPRAGRILWNEWPTGVAVTDAQQHGGPWPSSTASLTTSVGTAAVRRFQRPVAFQNVPHEWLPRELRG